VGRNSPFQEAGTTPARPSHGSVVALPGGLDIGGGPSAGVGRSIHGPIWLPRAKAIAFSDSGLNRRLIWSPESGYQVLHTDTNIALGTALDAQGRFVQCEWGSASVVRLETDGGRTVLADHVGNLRLNHPFALVIAAHGTIFFADQRLWYGVQPADAQDHSAIYALEPDGQIRPVIADLPRPGGLALSPDSQFLYVSDRDSQSVRRYAVKGAELSSGERFADLSSPGWQAGPQGMTTDAEGNLYVSAAGGVRILGPSGEQIGSIEVQASRITALAFGGEDLRDLYMTSAVGVGHVRVQRPGQPVAAAALVSTAAATKLTLRQEIVRLDPALDAIIAPGTDIRNVISADFLNDLGGGETDLYGRSLEGSFWHPGRNCVLFSDIGTDRRMRWEEDKGLAVESAAEGTYLNGANLDLNGDIITAEQGPPRRVSRRTPDGRTITVADHYQGKRFNRPNDVIIHSSGDFYLTDPWWNSGAPGEQERPPSVYRIAPDGSRVELVTDTFQLPNGIAFSPDERVLYISDTRERLVRAFDVAPDGTVDTASGRLFCDLSGPGQGTPDGVSVDRAGNVFVGGAGGLWILSPEGKHLGTVVHGGAQSNNLTFGGRDRRELYIVSWVAITALPVLTGAVV
jgi:gluconolactonase